MSGREWKPGDVAMTAKGTVALCHKGGQMRDINGAPWSNDRFPDNLRPLVVIDPEDREQVERLIRLMEGKIGTDEHLVSDTQAVLREFANPTPPCGASLTLGKAGALYRCSETAGHVGPHLDGTCTWTAKS